MRERDARGAAIVGMAARFPGAPDLEVFRRNIEAGVDAITEVPPGRWAEAFYDPSSSAPDRVYCRRGGFLGDKLGFDAAAFGIMPIAAQGAEPDQLLALEIASRALADAGYGDRPFPRERASVVLGRGGYLTPGVARLDLRVRFAEQLVHSLRALVPGVSDEQLAAVKAEFQAALGPYGADTAIGLVPNLAASRIANRLDLGGAAYTVDAACASSLVAIDHACRDLDDGRADLVIAGGVHLCQDPTFWSVFCQLGALSRSQQIRPFDRRADGLLVGEGVGMVVLKRLVDAERDGDRIYAVIRGAGVASDGRDASLMTPRVEGQIAALRRAWEQAALDPATVGLIEAHGTGTPAGDAAEIATLSRFFGPADASSPRAALGSVKSMIGHAMPAAGVAGLIKAALALYHRVLPPSLHCEEPRADLAATRFELIERARPWDGAGAPRRVGVNAFGFGGINAHVVLEEHASRARAPSIRAAAARVDDPAERPLLLAAESPAALLAALDAMGPGASAGPCRLALFNPTPERRARARAVVARGEAWRGRDDLWFSPRGLLGEGGRVAFLFPGVDSSFHPRVEDVARRFDTAKVASFAVPADGPRDLSGAGGDLKDLGMAIVAVGRLLDGALRALGVAPDVIAGHSIGEWTGMIASEMIPKDEVDPLIASLAPERVEVPDVVFVAAGCGAERATEALAGLSDIAISHDNCPHQVILCGRTASADAALERLARAGVLCQKLPFRSGYHAPFFADYVGPHVRVLSRVGFAVPATPLWSATTCAPYPSGSDAVLKLAIDHLVKPVRFRELTEVLYATGARAFVQVGTGSLVNFVSDTLRGRPHLAISANVPTRSGLSQLRRTVAALWVEGARATGERIGLPLPTPAADDAARRGEGGGSTPGAPGRIPASGAPSPAVVEISLGVPLVDLRPELALSPAALDGGDLAVDGLEGDPIAEELSLSFRELAEARGAVVSAWQAASAGDPALEPREAAERLQISVATHPDLLDHAFYRQPVGWPSLPDRYPVVPMTMLLSLMMDAAQRLVPELVPIGLEGVRAYRWLAIEPPADLSLVARYDGDNRVDVSIEGYCAGTVVLADGYPPAPLADEAPLLAERPAPITARELYDDRWMFHGPAYQGVVALGPIGEDGIRGTLVSLPAEGGLLDNAGQLLGYWVMERATSDRLAMPVRLDRVHFFAPHPQPGERIACMARVTAFGPSEVRADVELSSGEGRVWARIEGWEDRRFDSDDRVWRVFTHPEQSVLAEVREAGYCVVTPPWKSSASRDLLVRRYLGERERVALAAVGPRGQGEWLLARIAAKDCVRALLWSRGQGPIFPAEVEVEDDPSAGPILRGPRTRGLRVAIAHMDGIAVAIARDEGDAASGPPVGIDIVRIDARDAALEQAAFTPGERALLPLPGHDRGAWAARLRVAKAAAAKALGALDPTVAPDRCEVREASGERLLVAAPGGAGQGSRRVWVETRAEQQHMVGWTCT